MAVGVFRYVGSYYFFVELNISAVENEESFYVAICLSQLGQYRKAIKGLKH